MGKKTQVELEEDHRRLKIAFIFAFIFGVAFMFGVIQAIFILEDLESQLTECQEKIPTWNLTVECDYDWEEFEMISYTLTLNNHTKYIELLEELKGDEYCEVIQ